MHIAKREEDGVVVFRIRGSMDLYTMPEVKDIFGECIENGQTRVIVNLENVESMTSSGVGALIAFGQDLQRAGGALALAALSEPCRYVLELTKLAPLFSIYDSDSEAGAFLRGI